VKPGVVRGGAVNTNEGLSQSTLVGSASRSGHYPASVPMSKTPEVVEIREGLLTKTIKKSAPEGVVPESVH
jgi:hypothetical protein